MALIVLQVLIVFTMSSFKFHQVKLLWLHRQGWVAPIHPSSVRWIIIFGDNAEVRSQAATEAKRQNISALRLIWSALLEKETMTRKTSTSECQPVVDILNKNSMWLSIGLCQTRVSSQGCSFCGFRQYLTTF